MSRRPIRLIIADDHGVVREGLAALLGAEPDIEVVGLAGTGQEAVNLVRTKRPDIALLDITMPDMNGLEATRHITTYYPDVRVLILTIHDEETFFFEALRAGASGYVLKGASSEELFMAIRAVHEGGVYLPPMLARHLAEEYIHHHPPLPENDPLTPREREILALIAQGYTNQEIAQKLHLSLNTVKTHRRHIYEKLNLHSRSALIEYALRRGLLHP